jgi:Rieske Fe-S protein
MDLERRDFLVRAGALCAAGAMAWLGLGCGSGNKSNPAGPAPTGTATLSLAEHPALAADNSAVAINGTALGRPLIVTHLSGDTYHALDSRCTHQACTVAATTPTLNCPCHGSRFNLAGGVVNGPAPRPLNSYAVTREGDTLTVSF